MSGSNLIAVAIVIAGGLIGVGLYAGLSTRAPMPAAPPPPPPEPDRETMVREAAETTEAAQKALDALKPHLIETCWAPAIANDPEPAAAKWIWDVTFDKQGNEIARGISDVREMLRPDVGPCLRRQPMGLKVPPPSRNTRVTLELQLP